MFLLKLLTGKTENPADADAKSYAYPLLAVRFTSPASIAFIPGFYMTPVLKR